MKLRRWGKYVLWVLPLAAGLAGMCAVEGKPFLDSLYACLQMYALDFDGAADNLLIELARWTAPLVTASWVITAVTALRRRWTAWVRGLQSSSVAVVGGGEEKDELLRALGKRGIDGSGRFVRAGQYILLDDEEQNFAFCRKNARALGDRPVCMRCASVRTQASADARRRLFSPEENAARLFWKQSGLCREAAPAGQQGAIVLVGFGRLGEELLYWGLQDNLFDPAQKLTYHIFGDGRRFAGLHPGLAELSDAVVFHTQPWYEAQDVLRGARRVLVCGPDAAAEARDILFALPGVTLDVFAKPGADDFLAEHSRVRCFDWQREGMRPEVILGDELLRRAKRINLRYAVLYGGAADTPQELEARWNGLDAFARGSNLSSADYHEVRLQMLAARGIPADPAALPAAELERLAELEHMRWCRYHLLNNWRFGVPENGARKDAAKRIHRDLVPYASLTEAEKEKDRENIRVLLAMDA